VCAQIAAEPAARRRERQEWLGLGMHLNELVIEAGCAASHGVDLGLLTKIYMEFDRLRLDAKDPLDWTELMDAGHARENC
jgi:hypothetical protein